MVFDYAAAVDRLGGIGNFLEVAQLFVETLPDLEDSIRTAIHIGDLRSLERAAHTLKGSVEVFSARHVAVAARRLEIVACDAILDDAPSIWRELEVELRQLTSALRSSPAPVIAT